MSEDIKGGVNGPGGGRPELDNGWQDLFTPAVLKRGRYYYISGLVRITGRKGDEFSGTVEETRRTYTVWVTISNKQATILQCTCASALAGGRCRHQAAVLFALFDSRYAGVPAKDTPASGSAAPLALLSNNRGEAQKDAPAARGDENGADTSSDPFIAALDRKTERWKSELLDTSKRNRMINYRETGRSSIRIVSPDAVELFNKLALSDKTLTFEKPIGKDADLRAYSIISLMETLSYDLNVQVGDIRTAGTLIEREKTLKNMRSKAKLALEEQGANILYLCFGFIRWRENDRESSAWLTAPLLMMPVTLGMKSLNAPYTLSRYDDEIEVNPTLDHLFNTEYNIDLPTFELKGKTSLEEYFTQIEKIVDGRGWKLVRDVSLGLFSFLKISMYHDLNEHGDLMRSHPVLRAMAGDPRAVGELPAKAQGYDFDRAAPGEWHEVVDADSSQEEAILLSKLGVSFVMQGPPGTGKSQTITNIIAEALADGKKVLFVSEKAAALEVVLKRLTEAGLDDFCLSLHNYKANKKQIIASVGANLSLSAGYTDRAELAELTELFRDREFLNTYAKELHQTTEPLGESVYSVFGRICDLGDASVISFSLADPEKVTKERLDSMLYSVAAFEKALAGMGGRLSENPWAGTRAKTSGQNFRTQFIKDTEGLSGLLLKIEETGAQISSRIFVPAPGTFDDAVRLRDIAAAVVSRPSYMNAVWFDPSVRDRAAKTLAEAKSRSASLGRRRSEIDTAWDASVLSVDPQTLKDTFDGDIRLIFEGADENVSRSPLAECISERKLIAAEALRLGEGLLCAYREGLSLICYEQAEEGAARIGMLGRVLRLIADAPYVEEAWFDPRQNVSAAALIESAVRQSACVASLTQDILRDWEPSVFEIDFRTLLNRFKIEYVGAFRRFKPGYRADIRTLGTHSRRVGKMPDEASIIVLLMKLGELGEARAWFTANSEALSRIAGKRYAAEATDWNAVREGMAKALEITNEFPYAAVPGKTVSALIAVTYSPQLTGEARRLADLLCEEAVGAFEAELAKLPFADSLSGGTGLSGETLTRIKGFVENCGSGERYAAELARLKKDGHPSYADVRTLIPLLFAIREDKDWFDVHAEELSRAFAQAYAGEESDWGEIARGLECADSLFSLFDGEVPAEVIDLVCGQAQVDPSLGERIDELSALIGEAGQKLDATSALFDDADFKKHGLGETAKRYEELTGGFPALDKWIDYVESRNECDLLGLSDFTAKIAELDNTVPDVRAAFERGFYSLWLERQLEDFPAVRGFRRRVHEQRVEHFSELDVKQYGLASRRIREKIIRTFPTVNRTVKAGSQLGILRHEMSKKMRHMPVRKLFKSIPDLLLTLKPCLMMSPLSVAYFLDADTYKFDTVIFDEASQIFPQDAIGAIFRGKQVIIAGDSKQLPPTNFFAASTGNTGAGYDDVEGYDDEVYDSILEETSFILPNSTLLWHYRSRHEHLIAFSNREIYNGELITFPSCNEKEPDTGVEFVYVEDGVYESSPLNRNLPEAQRIAKLVEEHIEKHPDRSLGVIAFSEKQQQAISLEIQRFREEHPEHEPFFAEGKEDEFFVKNLENVQGDERDTIFFSVGYARTKEQKAKGSPMSMRFGPLGASGGERRLNVAITRARINVKLVSSILPSDIDLSRTDSEGVRMLREYISFAMNGESALALERGSERKDLFADRIASLIRENGYEVRQYVGCSGYRIDMAVKSGVEGDERYVCGIECDGYSYAGAVTARDRDRLRSSVLRRMGWELYRVWSAEWFKDPEREGERLMEFIRRAADVK